MAVEWPKSKDFALPRQGLLWHRHCFKGRGIYSLRMTGMINDIVANVRHAAMPLLNQE